VDDDEQKKAAVSAIVKFVVVAVAICVVLGLGTLLAVKVLGVGGDGGGTASGTNDPGDSSQPSDLPTVALTPDSSPSATPTETPTQAPTPQAGIQLSVTPAQAGAFERVNLTGTYAGQDNVQLQVQRNEGGTWTAFADVSATVKLGTFATYVKTSRPGDNSFRVYDPATDQASNPVTVTIR
jgi:hypothetical protein